MGGNKTRKLEFLVAEAQAIGANTLITAGAVQSNHCRQTAAAAARSGFGCILVLAGEETPVNTGNLLLDRQLGAEIVFSPRNERDRVLKETFDQAWEAGRRPYLIPYGGSSPAGASAYAFALREMLEQFAAGAGALGSGLPDWIVFASSSGGTQAGLALGARLFGYQGKLLGISVDEEAGVLQERVAALAANAGDFLGESKVLFDPGEILVNDSYLGGGYGVVGEAEREALRLFARTEGLVLDPVYTGRAAAGLIDLIRQKFFEPDQSVLFWHTGGAPALFAEQYRDIV
jgi:1-aminocyclopropane-1-carboxylate deaminase/D-cysteine desulfhydrase-like pyridoxal-dependent ACC family enzyme